MGTRWGPIADLEVAPAAVEALGGPAVVQEVLATAGPVVACQRCEQQAPVATTPLSLLVQMTPEDPEHPGGAIRVAFAHQRCLPSAVVVDPGVLDRLVGAGNDIHVRCGVRPVAPQALVI